MKTYKELLFERDYYSSFGNGLKLLNKIKRIKSISHRFGLDILFDNYVSFHESDNCVLIAKVDLYKINKSFSETINMDITITTYEEFYTIVNILLSKIEDGYTISIKDVRYYDLNQINIIIDDSYLGYQIITIPRL